MADEMDHLFGLRQATQMAVDDHAVEAAIYKYGSEREFGWRAILGGFPHDDEFGLESGHTLRLEQEVTEVLVAAATAQK